MHATSLGVEKLLSPGKAGGRNADAGRGIVRTSITISLHRGSQLLIAANENKQTGCGKQTRGGFGCSHGLVLIDFSEEIWKSKAGGLEGKALCVSSWWKDGDMAC